jgi:hypothetical protein
VHLIAIYSNHQATKENHKEKYLVTLYAFSHKDKSCGKNFQLNKKDKCIKGNGVT